MKGFGLVTCWLVVSAAVSSCAGDSSLAPASEAIGITRIFFEPGVTLVQAVELSRAHQVGVVRVRLAYASHAAEVAVDTASPFAEEEALAFEHKRLAWLVAQFDPAEPREAQARRAVADDLERLEADRWPDVERLDVGGHRAIPVGGIVRSVLAVSPDRLPTTSLLSQPLVTDWPADDLYVPLGGTSTIWETGSLQKFWYDGIGIQALGEAEDGLEIRTVLDAPGTVDCAMGQAASNLPSFYAGDWSLDFGYARHCTVGTTNAQALRPGVLYWTWNPFRSFRDTGNPEFTIEYRPVRWCPWVKTPPVCEALGGAWCMCGRTDLPPEPLVSYGYGDAPGQEVRWQRD